MRIGIDIRCLMEDEPTGVGSYTFQLLHALFRLDTRNHYILFGNTAKNISSPKYNYHNVTLKYTRIPNKLLHASLFVLKRPFLDTIIGGVDIFFFPNIHFLSVSPGCRMVVTVHDVSFCRFPEFYSYKARLWHAAVRPKSVYERSDAVVCVSDFSRNEIASLYGISGNRIHTVYSGVAPVSNAIDPVQLQKHRRERGLPDRFILFVGTMEKRKNIEMLVRTMEDPILPQDVSLVIAGSEGPSMPHSLYKRLKKNNRIQCRGYVREAEKEMLYMLAEALIYPSFYEGFGFPPLEAMRYGVPVVAGNSPALGEVLGDAALFIDPYNIEDGIQAVRSVLTDARLKNHFSQQGKLQAGRYAWDTAARKMLDIFQRVYEKGR